METKIISVGGSIVVPSFFDIDFLKKFRDIIIEYIGAGNRVVLIIGGGKVCRDYTNFARDNFNISNEDADMVGISITRANAEVVRTMFGKDAYESVIINPTLPIKTDKRIIIGAGWLPGCSTDMDAVLFAKNLMASELINMSNIEFVYDKDPKEFPDAKIIKNVSWDDFQKIVGEEWVSSMNVPFDPTATKLAKEINLKVIILKGTDIDNFKNCLYGNECKGTVIEK